MAEEERSSGTGTNVEYVTPSLLEWHLSIALRIVTHTLILINESCLLVFCYVIVETSESLC